MRISSLPSLFRQGLVHLGGNTVAPSASIPQLLHQPIVRRRLFVLGAAFVVCAYAAAVLVYVVTTPELGIRCAFSSTVNYFFENYSYPDRDHEHLREGDRIIKLDGQRIDDWTQLLRVQGKLRRQSPEVVEPDTFERMVEGPPGGRTRLRNSASGDEVVRVDFERNGKVQHVWCRLGRAPIETLVPSILWFFLKIGLFVVGAIVFWKRTGDRSAAQFFWLVIVSFGAYMGGYHWSRIVTQPTLLLVFMTCAILLAPVSLHFYLLFPRPKGLMERCPRWALLGIYGPSVLCLVLLLMGYVHLRWVTRGALDDASSARPLLDLMLIEIYCCFAVAALWYLFSISSLIHSYRTAANLTERNQVKWILFGALAAVVPIGYSLYLVVWDAGRFGGGGATWPMFLASFLVTGAYTISITRYRLMELDQIVSSGFIYFLISSVAGVVYYGLVFVAMVLVGSFVGDGPSLGHMLSVISAAFVLMVLLDLARTRLKGVLNRHFRREKHQLDRMLQRMSEAIEQLVDPPTLGRRLLHTTAELLGVARGAIYLRQGDPPLYHLADALGPPPPLTELSSGCPVVEAVRAPDNALLVAEAGGLRRGVRAAPPPGSSRSPQAERQLLLLGGEVAHALLHEGQLLGLLVLGPKEAGPYTPEDFNLLLAFAQLTVLALVSAEGHRTIDTLNRELQAKVEKIAEQQRRIIALQSQLLNRGPKPEERGAKYEDTTPREGGAASTSTSPRTPGAEPASGIVGSSPQIQQLMHLVRKVAVSQSAVLLRGETGTGKELLARALHENSPRAARPFITVHCTALSPGLLESELFGHVKGAFTSAIRDKVGRFEAAHGGTLFLDEIGDVSLEVQTKLLRVLQEKTFERVGSSEPVQVDVRIIAATHQDLERLIRGGRFREDLFYRLNVLPITLPPLRERVEDIAELVSHFLRLYAQRTGKEVTAIDDDALALLKAHPWPGNIRQLENYIQRAVVIAEGPTITVGELPSELVEEESSALPAEEDEVLLALPSVAADPEVLALRRAAADGSLPAASFVRSERADRERREREQLVRALAAAGGNKAEAARALGIARSTLVSRLKRLGLS